MKKSYINILGIKFINCLPADVVNELKNGGLLVVPAAPALVNINKDPDYFQALQSADVVIPDSGYMSLLWNLTHKSKLQRISGLAFLHSFFKDDGIKKSSDFFLINPNADEAKHNFDYLKSTGFNVNESSGYLAPFYGKQKVEDKVLLQMLEATKPKYVIINLGGGTQEKLGAYLKQNLSYKPAIICTGAAIAFLTGKQASIPGWGDRLYLGWLFRCFQNPKLYVPRYARAFRLVTIMLRYGRQQPV